MNHRERLMEYSKEELIGFLEDAAKNWLAHDGLWFLAVEGEFDLDTAIKKTRTFAQAMRKVDPSIQLIGWGDSGWAKPMIENAGEHLQFIAFHHMFNPDSKSEPTLVYDEFRKDPAKTWDQLMNAYKPHEAKIQRIRDESSSFPLALTECHFSIPGRNRCEVLSTWAAGVSYARLLNVHERHGDVLKIATAADFCGTRWQNNAIMIPVPRGKSFMMPVARVMSLYRNHVGTHSVETRSSIDDLDITASRKDKCFFLHVINTNRERSRTVKLSIEGMKIQSGEIHEIAESPEFEVMQFFPERIAPKKKSLPKGEVWTFPPASVSAVVLNGM